MILNSSIFDTDISLFFGKISIQRDLIKPTVSSLDRDKDCFDELCTFGQVAQCAHTFSPDRNILSITNGCQAFRVVKYKNLYCYHQLYCPGTDCWVCKGSSLLSPFLCCFPFSPLLPALWPFHCSLAPLPDGGAGPGTGVNSGKRLGGKEAESNGIHKVFRLSVDLIHPSHPQTLSLGVSSVQPWHWNLFFNSLFIHSYNQCDFRSKTSFSGCYKKQSLFFIFP